MKKTKEKSTAGPRYYQYDRYITLVALLVASGKKASKEERRVAVRSESFGIAFIY